MIISDVVPQKNNQTRVSVFVGDKYAFSMDEVDALVLNIKKGRELSDEEYSRCLELSTYAKAKEKALSVLATKSVTHKMLCDTLVKKDFDYDTAQMVCDELSELGYIDDMDYAMNFLEYAYEKLWGEKKIRYELSCRGVDKNTTEDAIANGKIANEEDICKNIEVLYRGLDLVDRKAKDKIMRHYVAKGFDFDTVKSAINLCIDNTKD